MKKIFKGLSLVLFSLFVLVLFAGFGASSASASMPTNTSIIINNGDATTASTSATLTLAATGATVMEISNDPTFSGAVWEPFMVTKSWMLTVGDGLKTVYAMFRDSSSSSSEDMSSNTSAVVSDTITLSGSGTVATVTIAGCGNSNVGFSTVTGQSCATNTVVGTASIPGCVSNVGFSPITGQSCATNPVMTKVVIPGCGNSTAGFSRVTGQSCANNLVNPGEDQNVSGNNNVSEDTFDFGNETLKDGSSGPAVMDLQKFLNKFENENLDVDGKLGPKTIAIIKKWQSDHGLVSDGLIGAKTKAQMHDESSGGSGSGNSVNSSNSLNSSASINSGSSGSSGGGSSSVGTGNSGSGSSSGSSTGGINY
jgi:hypothetical protein